MSFISPQITKQQLELMKGKSDLSALLTVFAGINQSVITKCPTDVVYFDFRKAFDSIPHDELLFKLWTMGITGPLWT